MELYSSGAKIKIIDIYSVLQIYYDNSKPVANKKSFFNVLFHNLLDYC